MQSYVMRERKGQVMIMSTIFIGAALLAATAVAGYMLFFQIRQAEDAVESAASFYAADAGIEDTLACYYNTFQDPNARVEDVCKKNGATYILGKNEGTCGADCIAIPSYSTTITCFADPADKTMQIECKTPATGEDLVKGIYILSKGSTKRAERVLDYTIITASGK